MTEKVKAEDPKKQVKDVEGRKCNKKQTSFQATYFHIFLTKKGMMTQKITKMFKYTMYQKDKSKHIFVQYVSIYFHLHLLKPDVITIFVHAVWISTLDIKVLQLSHALFVQKLFP